MTGLDPDAVRCELAAFDAGRVVRSKVARAVVAATYRERGLEAARARGVVLEHTPI
ncbi:MAG TPA: hypothetical protein VGB42_08440 [Candidatus Thermoplasmatota archaeon]